MPEFKPFALDDFVFEWGPKCTTGLWDSCVSPLTLTELQALSPETPLLSSTTQLQYGPRWGLPSLRENIRALYRTPGLEAQEDVVVTSGCISANHLILDTLVQPGDHVIVQHPTYGQLFEVPRRAGAEVELWKWKWTESEDGTFAWKMGFDELENLIRDTTKLIVLSNPNNPTGSILSKQDLQRVVNLAAKRGIYILCDEVFRFLHHDTEVEAPLSLLEHGYEKTIVTGSLSKGFALPGIRIGWIAMHASLRDSVLSKVKSSRDYTTIAVSQVDQQVAAFALEPRVRKQILARSGEICQRNLRTLSNWVSENKSSIQWAPPSGGGTTVLKILDSEGEAVDDLAFAEALAREEGVCVPPAGHCFGFEADGKGETELKGFVRIGIVMGEGELEKGLAGLERLGARWK